MTADSIPSVTAATEPGLARLPRPHRLFIGGAFVRSESGRMTELVESPGATMIETVPCASPKDLFSAINAAHRALEPWRAMSRPDRGRVILRLATTLEARTAELRESLVRGGAPEDRAQSEPLTCVDRAVAYAGWADKFRSLVSRVGGGTGPFIQATTPEPMGVVATVAPRRPALLGVVSTVLPLLVAGNTSIVLASEADPRTALLLGDLFAASGFPAGVVNLLSGRVADLAPHLLTHGDVSGLDLHGIDPSLLAPLLDRVGPNLVRVSVHALAEDGWYDAACLESPRWIERFVAPKTTWQGAYV